MCVSEGRGGMHSFLKAGERPCQRTKTVVAVTAGGTACAPPSPALPNPAHHRQRPPCERRCLLMATAATHPSDTRPCVFHGRTDGGPRPRDGEDRIQDRGCWPAPARRKLGALGCAPGYYCARSGRRRGSAAMAVGPPRHTPAEAFSASRRNRRPDTSSRAGRGRLAPLVPPGPIVCVCGVCVCVCGERDCKAGCLGWAGASRECRKQWPEMAVGCTRIEGHASGAGAGGTDLLATIVARAQTGRVAHQNLMLVSSSGLVRRPAAASLPSLNRTVTNPRPTLFQ